MFEAFIVAIAIIALCGLYAYCWFCSYRIKTLEEEKDKLKWDLEFTEYSNESLKERLEDAQFVKIHMPCADLPLSNQEIIEGVNSGRFQLYERETNILRSARRPDYGFCGEPLDKGNPNATQ